MPRVLTCHRHLSFRHVSHRLADQMQTRIERRTAQMPTRRLRCSVSRLSDWPLHLRSCWTPHGHLIRFIMGRSSTSGIARLGRFRLFALRLTRQASSEGPWKSSASTQVTTGFESDCGHQPRIRGRTRTHIHRAADIGGCGRGFSVACLTVATDSGTRVATARLLVVAQSFAATVLTLGRLLAVLGWAGV
jgi:hypothetical protein